MREHPGLGAMDEIPYAGINQIRFRVGGGSGHPLSLASQAPRARTLDPRHSVRHASVSPLGRMVKCAFGVTGSENLPRMLLIFDPMVFWPLLHHHDLLARITGAA